MSAITCFVFTTSFRAGSIQYSSRNYHHSPAALQYSAWINNMPAHPYLSHSGFSFPKMSIPVMITVLRWVWSVAKNVYPGISLACSFKWMLEAIFNINTTKDSKLFLRGPPASVIWILIYNVELQYCALVAEEAKKKSCFFIFHTSLINNLLHFLRIFKKILKNAWMKRSPTSVFCPVCWKGDSYTVIFSLVHLMACWQDAKNVHQS